MFCVNIKIVLNDNLPTDLQIIDHQRQPKFDTPQTT